MWGLKLFPSWVPFIKYGSFWIVSLKIVTSFDSFIRIWSSVSLSISPIISIPLHSRFTDIMSVDITGWSTIKQNYIYMFILFLSHL